MELSLGNGINPTSLLSTITNLFGFIIPSNWFNWKESKLFYAAQKSSYTGILRNQIVDTEILYFNIHRVAVDLKIYEYYYGRLQKLVDHIKANDREHKIHPEDLLMLENLVDEIRSNATYLNIVISNWYTYDLGVAMAYPDQVALGILPVALPHLIDAPLYKVSNQDLERIKNQSNDLITIRYLIRAAHYSRLSRTFSFLSAGGSGNESTLGLSFGLDLLADIRISSSEKRFLEIQLKEVSAKLESRFRILADVYNGSIDLYTQYFNAKNPNRALFYSVLSKYSHDKTLDVEKLIRAIDWALKFELNRNLAQHLYLITKSQMDRLLVLGDKYEFVHQIVPANEMLNRRTDKIKMKENEDIDYDIRKGKLVFDNP